MIKNIFLTALITVISTNTCSYYGQTTTDCYQSYSNSVIPGGMYTCKSSTPQIPPQTINNYYYNSEPYSTPSYNQIPYHIQRQERLKESAEEMAGHLKRWLDN